VPNAVVSVLSLHAWHWRYLRVLYRVKDQDPRVRVRTGRSAM
jgi:hypothetical protein